MNKQILRVALSALLSAGALLGTAPVSAYEAGDMVLRAGLAGVLPDSSFDKNDLGGTGVDVDDGYSLGVTFTYMTSSNLGIGVLAAWPFEHDLDGVGGLSGEVGSIKHLPPTVTLQYYFNTGSNLHPYVGAGVNYTYIFDEETRGDLSGVKMELDDSWGLTAEAGVDYDLGNNLIVSGQVWYLDIDTEAKLSGVGTLDVDIDPWVFMVSVGKKF